MKNKISHLLIFLITIIIPNKYCYSQDVIVNGRIDTDSIPTGHHFNYNLDIRAPRGYVRNNRRFLLPYKWYVSV